MLQAQRGPSLPKLTTHNTAEGFDNSVEALSFVRDVSDAVYTS